MATGKRMAMSDREIDELLNLIKQNYLKDKSASVWGNTFWRKMEGQGEYTKERKWTTLQNRAKSLSGSPRWNEAMKGLDIPLAGHAKVKAEKLKLSIAQSAWKKKDGINILREMIAFEGPLAFTTPEFWEKIKAATEVTQTADQIKDFFYGVLTKNLAKSGLPPAEIQMLRDRLASTDSEIGGVPEMYLTDDSEDDVEVLEDKISTVEKYKPSKVPTKPETIEQDLKSQDEVKSMKSKENATVVAKSENRKIDENATVIDGDLSECPNDPTTETFNSEDSESMETIQPRKRQQEGVVELEPIKKKKKACWTELQREGIETFKSIQLAAEKTSSASIDRIFRYLQTIIRGLGIALTILFEHKYQLQVPRYDENETLHYLMTLCRHNQHKDAEVKKICQGGMKAIVQARNQLRFMAVSSSCTSCNLKMEKI